MSLAKDHLHSSPEVEERKHKKKHWAQSLNSYYMDVKCPRRYKIITAFSHAHMPHCPLPEHRRKSELTEGAPSNRSTNQDE
ncbi:40S ribosomal protein S27 [Manis javanica]|nr:40S ribosomal protein S27 [Manis javanica]